MTHYQISHILRQKGIASISAINKAEAKNAIQDFVQRERDKLMEMRSWLTLRDLIEQETNTTRLFKKYRERASCHDNVS